MRKSEGQNGPGEERETRARLAGAINELLARRRFSQTEAARRLGVSQPKISALVNYRLEGFSAERLMYFLNALGCDVEIVIRMSRSQGKTGRTYVRAA